MKSPNKCLSLEAQQRYFSYRAILVAIVSQNSSVLVFMGYRTLIAQYVAKCGIEQMCLCDTKCQGGGIAPYWGSAHFPERVSHNMGYRSDSIAIWLDMGPLSILDFFPDFWGASGWSGARKRQRNSYTSTRSPGIFLWGKITGTNDFAEFSRKITWTRGLKKLKNVLQPVPVKYLISQKPLLGEVFFGSGE